jgi:hypothetical protein
MKANPEVKELLLKYFLSKQYSGLVLKKQYLEKTEKHFNQLVLMHKIKQLQDLCKEEKLSENICNVLYFAALHFKNYYSFQSNIKESFTREEEGLSQLAEAASFIMEIGKNNIEESKIEFSYIAKGIQHKIEITERKTLNKIEESILKLYIAEESAIFGNSEKYKLSEDYLLFVQKHLKKKKKPGPSEKNTNVYLMAKKLINFLQKETQMKNETKIISEDMGRFIYKYLKIFELIEYEAEYPEAGTAVIRSIFQEKQKKAHEKKY